MTGCEPGHVKDITFVPLHEERQKALDSTQHQSVWFYYRKSHKTSLCKAAPWYLQHIQCHSFCPLFELTMEKLLLASCESFDSILQVNFCFSWTDCWWLFLLFLSCKDNFIWRNLSCIQCTRPLHLFSVENTGEGIKGRISNCKDITIAALDCAIPWHHLMQGWKLIILLDVEFIVDSGLKIWKDFIAF